MERESSRLIGFGIIRGVVLTIYTKLYLQYFGYFKVEIHLCVCTQIGQRYHFGITRFLIYGFKIEIENSPFYLLFQRSTENLQNTVVLTR